MALVVTEPLSTALGHVAQPAQARTIFDLLDRNAPDIQKKLPPGIEWDWFEGTVRNELRRTPKLLECDPYSLAGAVVQAIALGLIPGALGHVYLVPYAKEVQFILGYKGMIELAFRSGRLKDIATGIVYEGDEFAFRKGTRPFLDHTPSGPQGERDFTHVYAIARLKTGGTEFEVLFPEEIEKAVKQSPTGKKGIGPWVEHREPMIRKTAVRRLSPVLPQWPLFAQALARDEAPAPLLGDGHDELAEEPLEENK